VRKIYLSIDPITPAVPTSQPDARPVTIPIFGFPNGYAAHRPAGLVYH